MTEVRDFQNKTRGAKPRRTRLEKLHEFDFSITKENAPRIIPFLLFLTFWAIVYIANRHYGIKTVREINQIERSLKDLKADYDTRNAELSHRSTQSEVAKAAASLGLQELKTPPKRLNISEKE